MRNIIAALVTSLALATAAMAGDADGKITRVDAERMTIQLDNGKTYRLPAEMDVSSITEGAEVIIAYEAKDGVNQITDMIFQ